MSRVVVSADVLRWALDRSEISPASLQHKFPKIGQWISGAGQPTLRQLESLAKTTLTPLGFFFLQNPPEERLSIPHFRTLHSEGMSRPSPNLLATVQMMERRQSWMREFLIDEGQEPLSFVNSTRLDEQHTLFAQRIRQTLGFNEGWASSKQTWTEALRMLREAIEGVGILVAVNGIVGNNTHRKLIVDEFRGFVLVDEYAPLVFVNGADGKAAQMFTLAHELAHVFLGSSAAFDLRQLRPADEPTELACNLAAAEFLVPERQLRREWDAAQSNPEPFQAIARHFKVSALVAARRALDLRLITRKKFLQFYHNYEQDERRVAVRQSEGGDFYASQNLRVGRRFATAVYRAAKEGKLLFSEAYRLTGLHGETFDRYMSHMGVGGR
jgi:Zn-dependent peptidase ImmA (M78 family)